MFIGTSRTDGVTFILGESNGKFALVCLTDQSRHLFDTEAEAKAFAETYQPKLHELN